MKPVARIGDLHACPGKTGKVPHVGGPVCRGLPSVLVGGAPIARVGDAAVCVGPIDTIASGAGKVLAGGQPVAHMGSRTRHGGVIVVGCPTVLVGG